MKAKNLLIFPAGTEIAFEIVNALKYSKFVNLYGGTSADDHSEFVYKNLIKGFPYINDKGFLTHLNRIIDEFSIDCVYPAHDSASVFFSEHSEEIHALVIITESRTTEICRSKMQTYKYFEGEKFIPKVYHAAESVEKFPVFVKPSVGQGSAGAKKIESMEKLTEALMEDDSIVICEYLPGAEYTVDCFTDLHGNLLVVKMRDRQRIRAGIAVRSRELECRTEIKEMAQILNSKLHFKGAWFFQVKENESGECRLLEISPRIPGTMGLSRNLGINFPLLTLFVFWGHEVSVIDNDYDIILDRAFYSCYKIEFEYEHIYFDFDDVIVLKGEVNQDVMRFIYQAKNDGKKLHILSRHEGDIRRDLRKFCICADLFESITVISALDEKKNYITEKKSIFIDDSFAERKKVRDALKIPVFDVDMMESLIDWRK
jgi:hypothetical protein